MTNKHEYFSIPSFEKCILNKVVRQCDICRQFTYKVNMDDASCTIPFCKYILPNCRNYGKLFLLRDKQFPVLSAFTIQPELLLPLR
jgi:hypothetical protein